MTLLDECWEWKGAVDKRGYGTKMINYRRFFTHRLAWSWANGPIPDGLSVLHRCDNPPCCNPSHLFVGTQADNIADMLSKKPHYHKTLTHCPSGHPYAGDNLKIRKRGARSCRTCLRAYGRAYYFKNRDRIRKQHNDYYRKRHPK